MLDLTDDIDSDPDGDPVTTYAPGDLLPGGVPAGERLGVGHRCETWLAWSAQLWSPVVVKFPRPHQVEHPRARTSLRREVAALAANLHPGLPRLHVDGTDAAVAHVVLEYVDGTALDDEIDDAGPFSPVDTALLAVALAAALRAVHARAIVHVDVKPENVMLRDGRPVLLDFGSARPTGAPQPRGALIGSPGYAAPELEAGDPIDPSMDVYGLGALLYESLSGQRAFEPELAAERRPAPAELPASATASVVERMLEPDPASRPHLDEVLRTFGEIAGDAAWPAWARNPVPTTLAPATTLR